LNKNRTTTTHFKIFKKEAGLWLDKFGLKDYSVCFLHSNEGPEDTRAWIESDFNGKIASIGLSRDWSGDEVTVHKVRRSAFHEVVHLLLANLIVLGQERWTVKGIYDAEEHAVIRRLEALFYGSGEN
jgi:hypothetical protein